MRSSLVIGMKEQNSRLKFHLENSSYILLKQLAVKCGEEGANIEMLF